MKKIVYIVREFCTTMSGDDFDLYYTFNLEDARKALANEAWRGYNLNQKNPNKVKYIIFGYEVDTEDIDECYDDYDVNDAESLFDAYVSSQCSLVHIFDEEWSENDN